VPFSLPAAAMTLATKLSQAPAADAGATTIPAWPAARVGARCRLLPPTAFARRRGAGARRGLAVGRGVASISAALFWPPPHSGAARALPAPCLSALSSPCACRLRRRRPPAAVSSSLKNLLLSVLAGGSVLVVIAVAVVGVSSFDKTSRKD
jgi:hypothetical protein